jgi:predicted GH43/DUF377 family glycosyl hydrolase
MFMIEALLSCIRTPHKLGRLVLEPSFREGDFDSHAVDCPFLFHHEDCYWMTHVGWDGAGYQTGLARSDDLLNWEKQGILIGRGPKGSVTEHNMAMTSILRDNELFGPGELKRVDGRFVGTWHAYPESGYETGPGVIGLCFSEDLRHWEVGEPILGPNPASAWEAKGLYKSWVLEHDGTFYLFYNARDKPKPSEDPAYANDPWKEESGVVTSQDLVSWERYEGNPVLRVGEPGEFDDRFAADPCVLRREDTWVMFYYGNCTDGHARNGVAFSSDLLHWEKSREVLIDVGPPGALDTRYAHKPGIISKDGILYHFYCAVGPARQKTLAALTHGEVRGISVAMGKPD